MVPCLGCLTSRARRPACMLVRATQEYDFSICLNLAVSTKMLIPFPKGLALNVVERESHGEDAD